MYSSLRGAGKLTINMEKISTSEFKTLGEEWIALDAEYDAEFQTFLENPNASTAENLGSISKERFQELGREWVALDNEYDNFFQEFLDSPSVHAPEKIAQFRDMQGRIYPLEDEIYKVAERCFSSQEIQQWKTKQKRLYDIELELYKVAEGTMVVED